MLLPRSRYAIGFWGTLKESYSPARSPNPTMDQPLEKEALQKNSAAAPAISPAQLTPPPLPIDWHHLHQISDHNPEFELELLQMFADDTEQHLTQLEAAIATQDFPALEQQAHYIKGSSANVGLRPMQTAASNLEIQARSYQLDNPALQVLVLQQTLRTLRIFLAAK